MAAKGPRENITLECTECKRRNVKYCKYCKKRTTHKETK